MRLVLVAPCLLLPLLSGCGGSPEDLPQSITLDYPVSQPGVAARAEQECKAYGETAHAEGVQKREEGEVAVFRCS